MDEARNLFSRDKSWMEFCIGSNRLIYKCHEKYEKNYKLRNFRTRMFKSAYVISQLNINSFCKESSGPMDSVRESSLAMLTAFEKIMGQTNEILAMDAEFDVDLLCKEDVLDLNDKLKTYSELSFTLVSSTSKVLFPYYKRIRQTLDAMERVMNVQHWVEPLLVLRQSLQIVLNTVETNVKRTLSGIRMNDEGGDEASEQSINSIVSLYKKRYGGDLYNSIPEFLHHNAVINQKKFTFDEKYERRVPGIDIFNQLTVTVTEMIRNELKRDVDAKNSIICYFRLLELGAGIGGVELEEYARTRALFGSVVDKWSSGRVSWEDAIGLLDTYIGVMQRGFPEAQRLWDKERVVIVSKTPNAVAAFVKGLKDVVSIQRMARMRKISIHVASVIARRSNHEIYKFLTEAFRLRHTLVGPSKTRNAMVEILDTNPFLKKNVVEKRKGAMFLLHGMFVAHVAVRRSCLTDLALIPEILMMDGFNLCSLQKDVWLFCDAAFVISSLHDKDEIRSALDYMTRMRNDILVFSMLPISKESIERVESSVPGRPAFLNRLTRFFAFTSMRMGTRKLPSAIEILQSMANKIIEQLEPIIRVNRGVHHLDFRKLAKEMCCK